jgi:hypothetical protein
MHLSYFLPTDAVFEKGQLIAKAIKLEEPSDEWQYFVGRVNGNTKDGPWLYFLDDNQQVKQVQLPIPPALACTPPMLLTHAVYDAVLLICLTSRCMQKDIAASNYNSLWLFVDPLAPPPPTSARSLLDSQKEAAVKPKAVKPKAVVKPSRTTSRQAAIKAKAEQDKQLQVEQEAEAQDLDSEQYNVIARLIQTTAAPRVTPLQPQLTPLPCHPTSPQSDDPNKTEEEKDAAWAEMFSKAAKASARASRESREKEAAAAKQAEAATASALAASEAIPMATLEDEGMAAVANPPLGLYTRAVHSTYTATLHNV